MFMLLHFAYEYVLVALISVHMRRGCVFSFGCIRGLGRCVAFRSMHMSFALGRAAHQQPLQFIAFIAMCMAAVAFLQAAYISAFQAVAIFGMLMLLSAVKHLLLDCAVSVMPVAFRFLQAAYQFTPRFKALVAMSMPACLLQTAYQLRFSSWRGRFRSIGLRFVIAAYQPPLIAAFAMRMRFLAAICGLFHGYGREYQHVRSDKNHYAGQTSHYSLPSSVLSVLFGVRLSLRYQFIPHILPPFPIPRGPCNPMAKRGTVSCPLSAPAPRIPPQYCANLPK